jgi:hypothetical protein
MTKSLLKSLIVTPAILGTALALSANASEVPSVAGASSNNNDQMLQQLDQYSQEGQSIDQVNSVFQLRDVAPTDWAFEALRNLVEKYGCIAGYPDGTYKGQRSLTRYEFAAGLNACLQSIERLILGGGIDTGDADSIRRLVQEFEAELATLGARVDDLEGRVAYLEDHQFSVTTKLKGEAIFALSDEWGQSVDNETVFQDRVRLTLQSSFSGKDKLVTRLAAGNANLFNSSASPYPYSLIEGTQTFNIGSPGNNDIFLDWLGYYFPVGDNIDVYVAATGGIHSDYVPTLNPYFEDYDGGNGALSSFASENPIYRIGGGSGLGINLKFGEEGFLGNTGVSLGYFADGIRFGGADAADPQEGGGLFNGDYAALAQITFATDRFGVGATYVNSFHHSGTALFDLGTDGGVVGTGFANNPFSAVNAGTQAIVGNSYGLEAAFRLTDTISISGFGSYTDAILIGRGGAEIWTYGAGVAIADLGKEGSVLGVFGGVQPYAGGVYTGGGDYQNQADPWTVEAFYKYQLNDNISITPGVIWVNSTDQAESGDDAWIGTLRTTFSF